MKRVRPHPFSTAFAYLAVLTLSGAFVPDSGSLRAGEPGPPAAPPPPIFDPSVKPSTSGVTFLTKKTRLWLGRSQVICFYAKQTPDEDRFFSFNVDETYLHVLIPPTLVPGAHLGYVRVRPMVEGKTQVSLDGATLDVEIVKDTAASTLELTRPEIVSPARGSVVWGKFDVGVEQLNLSTNEHPPLPVLRLPDGSQIEAQAVPAQQPGPHLHYVFTVDADKLHPGSNELTAIFTEASGHQVISEPMDVNVIKPDPASILSGDCKDQINTQLPPPPVPPAPPLAAPPKAPVPPTTVASSTNAPSAVLPPATVTVSSTNAPSAQPKTPAPPTAVASSTNVPAAVPPPATVAASQPKVPPVPPAAAPPAKIFVPPTVIADDKGVFPSIVSNPNDNQPWCMPVTVSSKGLYQMIVTARGDMGGNALPTLALMVDNSQNAATTARLATTDWQRLPVGIPFTLEAGDHVLFVRFRNGFGSGPLDSRHLYLARYELVRLDQPSAPLVASNEGGGGSMMQQTSMQPSMQSTTMPPAMQDNSMQAKPAPDMAMQAKPTGAPMIQSMALPGSFHIVFKDALDGQTITGPVQISAMCWWPNRDHSPPPTVDLLVNDKVAATLSTPQPQFQIPPTAFQPGANKLVLQATLPNGQRAQSGVETIFLPVSPTTPVARIVYPANGAKVGLADAVVADVSGNTAPYKADLLIDGQPQHLNLKPHNGLGPILFPLLTRNLTPGPHHLQVTLSDLAGKTGTSGSEIVVTVTGKDEALGNAYTRAVYLLNRFGYGPEPRELAAILTQGPHAWLQARLNETIESPTEENEEVRLHAEYPDINAVVPRATGYLITDANPVRARFLMWTENHFSTWLSKDEPREKAREHDRFLELGVAPFPDLLLASATSPAMLIYLDQRNSVAHRLNENYAREIMELHTLGVKGGYTQLDVTTLADLLTGWTLADEAPVDGSSNLARTFRYDPYLNSGSACRILGMEFPGVPLDRRFDRVLTALNMLAAHPSCAQFISRKLVEHYVSDPAPPELVNDLARLYMENGGDLREMLLALSEKPAFWAAPAKVASPIDFAVRLARLARLNNPNPVNDLASHSGMGMFDRATPDGYPDTDGYFASSNALLQRWHFAQTIQPIFLNNGLIPDDWKPADNQWNPDTTQKILDLAAVRITGNVLGAESNTAATQLLASAPVNTAARLQILTTFLCQTPETSLR